MLYMNDLTKNFTNSFHNRPFAEILKTIAHLLLNPHCPLIAKTAPK